MQWFLDEKESISRWASSLSRSSKWREATSLLSSLIKDDENDEEEDDVAVQIAAKKLAELLKAQNPSILDALKKELE